MPNSHSILLSILFILTMFSNALGQNLTDLLDRLEKNNDPTQHLALLIKIGDFYTKQEAYLKANEYYNRAIKDGETTISTSEKIDLMESIAINHGQLKNYRQAIKTYERADSLAATPAQRERILQGLSSYYQEEGYFGQAITHNEKLVEIYKQSGKKQEHAEALNRLGILHRYLWQYQKSLPFFDQALELSKNPDQKNDILLNKAISFVWLEDFKRAKAILERIVYSSVDHQKVDALNYIAFTNYLEKRYEEALRSGLTANEIAEALQDKDLLLANYKILTDIYRATENYKLSQDYLQKYQDLKQRIEIKAEARQDTLTQKQLAVEQEEGEIRSVLAERAKQEGLLREAQLESEKKANQLRLQEQRLALLRQEQALREAQFQKQKLEKERIAQQLRLTEQQALAAAKENELQAQRQEAEKQKLLAEKAEAERLKKQQELEASEKEKKLQAQQLEQEKSLRVYSYGIIALIVIILILVGISYIASRKARRALTRKNQEIKLKNEEILTQNEELRQTQEELQTQRDFVAERNAQLLVAQDELQSTNKALQDKDVLISASLNYAQNIQSAILPFSTRIDQHFPNHFIIYYPKDVVSGDFYWLGKIEHTTIFGVIDCTGHGVPGAFMSMIGYSLLNEIIISKKITSPDLILEHAHQMIREALKQDESKNLDGMDASFITVKSDETEHITLTFGGAKMPLYYYDVTDQAIKEIKGTRRSLGGNQTKNKPFEKHELSLQQGSTLYLISDGFVDQNDPNRKKFGSNKLVQLLNEVCQLPLHEQREQIEAAYFAHKQNEAQRDDITFVALRV
ncbi:MAG: SpoIIE family protein phosphatase [Flammeovirgaceae bacterium]